MASRYTAKNGVTLPGDVQKRDETENVAAMIKLPVLGFQGVLMILSIV